MEENNAVVEGFTQLLVDEQERETNPVVEGYEQLYANQQSYFSEQKKALSTTTLLTALATAPKDPTGVILGRETLELSKQALERGEESAIRSQIVTNRLEQQLRTVARVGQEVAVQNDPALFAGVEQSYRDIVEWDLERKARTALEEEAIDRIRTAAMSDPVQARVLLDNIDYGNADESKRQFLVKMSILRQRADELDDAYQQSGWGRWLINQALNLVPVNFNFARTGIIGTAGVTDLLAVGSAQQEESNALWNMPMEAFAEFAAKDGELMKSIRDNATSLFEIGDPGAAIDIMENLITTGEHAKNVNNVWGGIEVASALPWTLMARATRTLVATGATNAAVRNLDNALLELETRGPKVMEEVTGVTERELVDELSVTAVRGDQGIVPLSEPVSTHRAAAQKAIDELFNSPEFARFSSVEEQQAFLEGRMKEIQAEIGSPIKDIKYVHETLPAGQSITRVEFTVGKKDGFGFATPGAARRSARAMGLGSEAEVVEQAAKQPKIKPLKGTLEKQSEAGGFNGSEKSYVYKYTSDAGDEAIIRLVTYPEGRGVVAVEGLMVNAFGPSEMRSIAATIADELPDLKTISGPRTSGARSNTGKVGEEVLINVESLRGQMQVTQDMSGQWFVKVTRDMPEAGWFTTKLAPEQQGFVGRMVGRWLSSAARNSDPTLHGMAIEAGSYLNRAAKHIDNQLMGVFRKLPKQSQEVVREIGKRGTVQEKWFSTDEFDFLVERSWGRKATEAEHKAYSDLRLFNDMDWELRNTAMYLDGVMKGKQSVKFRTRWKEDINEDVIIDYKMESLPTERVYDVSRNKHYVHGRNPLTSKDLRTMQANGYVMMTFPEGFRLPEGIVTNKVLVKKTDIEISPLKREQLAYSEGGHRMYTARVFVKQGRKGKQHDTGTEYLASPATFRTAENIAEGKNWATVMNRAREAVKKNRGISSQELDDTIFRNDPSYPTGEEFLNGVADETYDLDNAFEAVFDRDMPSMYNTSGKDLTRMFNEDELGVNGYYRTTGRMYTSGKGEILRDTKGRVSEILDPYDTLSQSLSQVTRQLGLYNYKMSAMERFSRTFEQWMVTDPNLRSPAQVLTDGKVSPTAPIEVRNQIEAQREAILNVLRFETEGERLARQAYQSLAEKAIGDGSSFARKLAHDAVWWWKESNPIAALRGLAFDSKLGMFNPGQLLVQSSTMLSAMAMSPRFGMQGMAGLMPMHAYILKGGSENVLDLMVKRNVGKVMGFDDVDEFKEYARHAFRHGFMEMNGSHIMINNHGTAAHFGSFAEKQTRFREQARVFFYTSEVYNRLVAYRIAWGEARRKGLTAADPQFNATILKLADDYSFNMTSESAARWQKGLWSIPTQFWAYNMRMIEAMFGKRFTPAQRARLIGLNFAMAGTAGIPGVQAISEYIKQKHGSSPPIGSVTSMVDRGLIDYLNYQATGQDVLIGERIGTGGWATDVVKSLFGASEFGVQSFDEIVGGATYSIGKSTGKTLLNLGKYAVAESGTEDVVGAMTRDNILNVFKEISTFGNASKAYLIHRYGILKANSGTIIADELPAGNAIYQALSFRPAKAEEISYMMAWREDREEIVKDVSKQLRSWRQEAASTGDYEKYWKKANVMIRLIPPMDRREVLRAANQADDQSFYDFIERKVTEEQTEQQMAEGFEQ